MKKKELQDAWTSLSIFIKTKCTFDIGSIDKFIKHSI
jgi:hypothetical protein